jgi:hypothetical protein
MKQVMTTGLVGSIPYQDEIYVAAEKNGYVSITTEVGEEYEQCIHIRASDVDALIGLLVAAKREALEAKG